MKTPRSFTANLPSAEVFNTETNKLGLGFLFFCKEKRDREKKMARQDGRQATVGFGREDLDEKQKEHSRLLLIPHSLVYI